MSSALEEEGAGFIMTPSRQILYPSSGPDYAQAARRRAEALRHQINRQRDAALAERAMRG